MTKYWFLFFFIAAPVVTKAQYFVPVHITGKIAFADTAKDFVAVKIFNKRMSDFISPNRDGTFELYGFKTDTFIFLCQGYEPEQLCYKDSIRKLSYEVYIIFQRPMVYIKEVVIVPQKTIDQIQREVQNLQVRQTDRYTHVDPIHHPITALWEIFSKQETEKRKEAKLEDNDMRRKLMREMLKLCVKDSLINLQLSQTDAFIDYCNYSDSYLKQVNMYDLLSSIKVNYSYFTGER